MEILKHCGGELEHSLRRRFIEQFSTEEYINELEDIMTSTKIDRTWKKIDMKIQNEPFINKDKEKKPFKRNNTNDQRKCDKCGGIGN
ncbi:hypothetical protein O181_013922 [Austropuccinia psidii MF-1]|uniref:Uncharacterized protein n=1 Tax=Austropuccinia psidii MF-1 TaxID=1389203 RepID=A0A9Q3GPE0_9BASI|nr:hypothetical protein [Austropuccinia psidii MF-1]